MGIILRLHSNKLWVFSFMTACQSLLIMEMWPDSVAIIPCSFMTGLDILKIQRQSNALIARRLFQTVLSAAIRQLAACARLNSCLTLSLTDLMWLTLFVCTNFVGSRTWCLLVPFNALWAVAKSAKRLKILIMQNLAELVCQDTIANQLEDHIQLPLLAKEVCHLLLQRNGIT
jgi:hypothetical protein